MPTVRCPVDGTEFDIAPSHLARLKRPPTCSPECKREAMRGEGHWHWRGGTYVDAEGYRRVWTPDNRYEMEHRVKMAKKLKRPLREGEVVRHKDGDRLNNRISNLLLVVETPARNRRPRRGDVSRAARPRGARRGAARRVVRRAR